MAQAPLLEIEGLSGGYEIDVLHDVTLQVPQGSVTVVLGANGAGKTTLLKCLSGTARVSAGTVRLATTDVLRVAPAKRLALGIAHVPQGRRIFPSLSVEENLFAGMSGLRLTRGEAAKRVGEAYEVFPVLSDKRASAGLLLSGGQQQMLAVARGLVSRPSVLLLDEPSVGLAPSVVSDLFARFSWIREAYGTSIVLVEQRVKEALDIADTVAVLRHGRVALSGVDPSNVTIDELLATYL